MRVLIVGAGAVGQVYARHLQHGGADITFLVKEKYRAEVAAGLSLYWLNHFRPGQAPDRFTRFDVITSLQQATRPFDQVWLCIAGPALSGDWLPTLVRDAGPATWVVFQVSPEDRELVAAAGVPPERMVNGLITFASYAAPLEGETRYPTPGTAYYQPVFMPNPFSGPAALVHQVVSTLEQGGLVATARPDVPRESAYPSALLMTYLAALERAHWSIARLLAEGLPLATAAAADALAIVARRAGPVPLGPRLLTREALVRLALPVLVRVSPLPLEAYLKKHFTKVRSQTRQALERLLVRADAEGLPATALRELVAATRTAP